MFTKKQVEEIREHLHRANNPLFLFDNDPDGLCSFLILQRYLRKGKGFPVRSFPDLNVSYFRKIEELNPDYIFILDKPLVSKEFFEKVHEANIPVVWIDHHEMDKSAVPDFVSYYNPLFNRKKTNEPVTALCYQINKDSSMDWLAAAGSVSDRFFPDFYESVKEKYPDLAINSENAFDIFYNSQIGKIARIFSFALKDRTTNVIMMLKFLMKVKTPYEILNESSANYSMHKRFNEIESKYQVLIRKAMTSSGDKDNVLFFKYGGALSISSDVSNFLSFKFPDKIIVVVYTIGSKANISMRGRSIKGRIVKILEGFDKATGGGHDDAVGAQIKIEDVDSFREKVEEKFKE